MAHRNASNPKAVEAATRLAKRRADREAGDLRWLMSDARGRRFIWKLLGNAGIFRTSFTGNSETFFREGARSIGLQVFAELHQVVPDAYLTMAKEAAALEAQEANEANAVTRNTEGSDD